MLSQVCCLLAAFLFRVSVQAAQISEPAAGSIDFNITHALWELDVDVDELPSPKLGPPSSERACFSACTSLDVLYHDELIYKDDAANSNWTNEFWSKQQAEAQPYCILKAPDAQAVSVAVLISRLFQCPFAVKSGGHAAFNGASNINGGITISLERLNSINVSEDRATASIGAGNRWGNVYKALAPYDVTVIGGRVASIGVGGLTTGGGISFFSNLHGWTCDNVISYDVVLASGMATIASAKQNTDLFWALRGGGNNFGIVTNFNYETIALPGNAMWGGTRIYTEQDFETITNAFHNFIANSAADPKAGQWIAWASINDTRIGITEFYYAEPNCDNASIWSGYKSATPLSDTTGNRLLWEYAQDLDKSNPYGRRETYHSVTVKLDPELLHISRHIFYDELPSVSHIAGIGPALIHQGITHGQLAAMSKNGGNALGLDPEQPLYLIQISTWWDNASDDDAVYSFVSRVLGRIKAEAKKRGADSDFIYMNYGGVYQDVIRGYGKENQARLQRVARKYDPQRVMQELQPGYFKLERAPVVDERYLSGV